MSILEKGFINQEGKITWTAVAVAYGLVLITLITAKWLIEDEVSLSYLEWSTVIIPILLGARPAQRAFQSFGGYISRHKKEVPEIGSKTANKEVEQIGNFGLWEFESKDGSKMPEDVKNNVHELINQLEIIRDACGDRKINISSGYRSPTHNATIPKAATGSQHLYGKAADFLVQGMKPADTVKVVKRLIDEGKIIPGGLAYERGFVHYDTRGHYATWKY